MIGILVIVVLCLIGTHYMAYVLGEEAGDVKWSIRMKKLQDYYLEKEAEVKSVVKKARKVAIKKK